jgi:hypothetical protein
MNEMHGATMWAMLFSLSMFLITSKASRGGI